MYLISYFLALAIVVTTVTVPLTEVSKGDTPTSPPTSPTPSPVASPTIGPGGELVVNANFGDGFNDWEVISYGVDEPYIGTYSPATNGFSDAIKPGDANNYFVGCGAADEYSFDVVNQVVDLGTAQDSAYSFTYYPGGVTSGGGESMGFLIFFDSDGNEIQDDWLIYVISSITFTNTEFNTNYVKTDLRLTVDVLGVVGDDPTYVVYRAVSRNDIVIMFYGGIAWRFYRGITWTVDDLENGFNLGTDGVNYVVETYTASTSIRDSLNYPGQAGTGFVSAFDEIRMMFLTTMRYNGATYDDEFKEMTIDSLTIPSNAVSANVSGIFLTSTDPCNGAIDRLSLKLVT